MQGGHIDNSENTITPDTDNDGYQDYIDIDADNDGIFDVVEGGDEDLDTNNDGVIDSNDTGYADNDNNGMADSSESTIETDRIEIITPSCRGCQLSIRVKNLNKELFNKITQRGVVADWREPDVIRVAPVPLYNSFEEIFQFYLIFTESL